MTEKIFGLIKLFETENAIEELAPNNTWRLNDIAYRLEDVEFLGAGIHRAAYLVDGVVVKLPIHGSSANYREFLFWETAKNDERLREIFAEVKHYLPDHNVLIQSYCGDSFDSLDWMDRPNAYAAAVKKFAPIFNAARVIPEDYHTGNVSLSGKIFDYAQFRWA